MGSLVSFKSNPVFPPSRLKVPKGGIVVKRLLWWQQNGEYLKHSFNRTRFLKVLIHKRTSPFNKNLGWCTELSVIGLHTFNPGNQFILSSSDCTNLSFSKKCIILKAPWLFYSPHGRESGFPNLANFHYWIRNPGLWNPSPTDYEWNPSTWNTESTAENPESKRVLVFCIFC